MSSMDLAQKALWIIERNSDQAWTLESLAAASGVSRSHLANVFATSRGRPVMHYLRHRRLSRAAEALASGAPDILNVALDCGYGSHEAFTRAFRELFGRSPEQVRSSGTTQGLKVVAPLALEKAPRAQLDAPRLAQTGQMHAIGLTEPCSIDTLIRIPDQWQRFMQRYEEIENVADEIPIGLVKAPDADGVFDYTCAAEVSRVENIPRGLHAFSLQARTYAVFEHRAHVSHIFDTYEAIWNDALPAIERTMADSLVIERHNPTFNPMTGEGGVAIWVPLA